MPRRLALALLAALSCAVAAGAASVALSLRAQRTSLRASAERAAATVQLAYAREERAASSLLRELCARDAQVERFALELAAGGGDPVEAKRTALGLGRVLSETRALPSLRSRVEPRAAAEPSAEAWLLVERAGAIAVLGASGAAPGELPSAQALRAASGRLCTYPGEQALVIASCARALGPATLWVVRAEPLEQLRARLLPAEAASFRSRAPARALTVQLLDAAHAAADNAQEHADVLALRIEAADGTPATELWLRANEPPRFDTLAALAPLLALALVSAVAVAFLSAARPGVQDADLAELERAAERVAQGDLTARIERRSGGRADQTFATFDRMTAELKEMRTRLAEAERAAAWQDMARRIAHEIKNPLAPIQTAIETLRKAQQRKLPAFDEIFEESTRAILEEVRRLERIVREFSEFARLPRARPGALELSALVADTLALYQPEGIHVELVRPSGPVQARADREQLTQVIVNLLQNACDAARAGTEPRVELRIESDARAVYLHIDDNGRGVPPDERERIFEPYYTTKQHGTGLGLAIVRRIALDHEGSVQVGESPLAGARFTLRLPRPPT